jgi:hypothetical protein
MVQLKIVICSLLLISLFGCTYSSEDIQYGTKNGLNCEMVIVTSSNRSVIVTNNFCRDTINNNILVTPPTSVISNSIFSDIINDISSGAMSLVMPFIALL